MVYGMNSISVSPNFDPNFWGDFRLTREFCPLLLLLGDFIAQADKSGVKSFLNSELHMLGVGLKVPYKVIGFLAVPYFFHSTNEMATQ